MFQSQKLFFIFSSLIEAEIRLKISGKIYATEEEMNPDIWLKKTVTSASSTPKITPLDNRVVFEENSCVKCNW